jgi:hypothetical protein
LSARSYDLCNSQTVMYMSKKPRHLRAVAEPPRSNTAKFAKPQNDFLTFSDLPMIAEEIDYMHGMVLEFRMVQSLMPLSEAGAELLEPVKRQFEEGTIIIDAYESLLQSWLSEPQMKSKTKFLEAVLLKLNEVKVLLAGTLATLELDINLSSSPRGRKTKAKKSIRDKGTDAACEGPHAFKLKVTLKGAKPPIWRRLLMPGNATLAELHSEIQNSMGWNNSHLHQFCINGELYSNPSDVNDALNERRFSLEDFQLWVGDKFTYEYDFGDGWVHEVKVEEVKHEDLAHPKCIGGKRACPPEDCGGIYRYMWMLDVLKDLKHPEREELLEWLEEEFDPEYVGIEFDV